MNTFKAKLRLCLFFYVVTFARHKWQMMKKVMKKVTVKAVATRREMDDFVQLPHHLYRNTPQYVPDLDQDVRETFDPKKNPGLDYSEMQPFVAYDENGKCVGRIAGIINRNANEKWNTHNVRFGLIEFVDDLDVSSALLDAVADWGRKRGMDAIQGPMGITDFEKEGMLVEDFDMTGSMISIYNHEYYPRHMEQLGFQKEADWLQIQIEIPKEIPERYARVAKLSKQMFGLHVKKLSKKEIMQEGYGKKVFDLLNLAYSPLFGYSAFTDKQIDAFVNRYIPLINLDLVSAVEDGDGRLIGVGITMSGLSDALRKSKGKLFPFGWYHLLKSLKWKHEGKVELMLVGVHPDYQGLGVNALFFNDLIPIYNKLGYTWAETGPQLETNVKELSQWKPLNPKTVKRRRCYTKKL